MSDPRHDASEPAFAPGWCDTPSVRAAAASIVHDLHADLLSHASATLTLEAWAVSHGLAAPGTRLRALLRRGVGTVMPGLNERLRLTGGEQAAYRHVSLMVGDHVLSMADNWFVRSRLTPEMNAQLDETDTPFGRVVSPLGFHRAWLAAETLWAPDHGSPRPGGIRPLAVPDEILRDRALLITAEGLPISEVRETYTSELLRFPLALHRTIH